MSKEFPFPSNLDAGAIEASATDSQLANQLGFKLVRYLRADSWDTCHCAILQLHQMHAGEIARILGVYMGHIDEDHTVVGVFLVDRSRVKAGGREEVQVLSQESGLAFINDFEPDDVIAFKALTELILRYAEVEDAGGRIWFVEPWNVFVWKHGVPVRTADGDSHVVFRDSGFEPAFLREVSMEWMLDTDVDALIP